MPAAATPAPTDVLTLVFCAWTAGTAAFGAWSRLWGQTSRSAGRKIQPGHFKVIWLVTAGLAAAAGFGYPPVWAVAGGALLTFVAIYRGKDRELGVLTAVGAIVALSFLGPLYGFAPAALLGAVTNAMLLGHWHLNQPKLGTEPIARLVWGVFVGLGVFIAATVGVVTLRDAGGVGVVGAVTATAFAALAVVLTAMVRHLVRTRSIMSATGILYLEILVAFVAVFTGSLAALAPA